MLSLKSESNLNTDKYTCKLTSRKMFSITKTLNSENIFLYWKLFKWAQEKIYFITDTQSCLGEKKHIFYNRCSVEQANTDGSIISTQKCSYGKKILQLKRTDFIDHLCLVKRVLGNGGSVPAPQAPCHAWPANICSFMENNRPF